MNKSIKLINKLTLNIVILTMVFVSFFGLFIGLKINAEQKSMETSAFLGGGTGWADNPWKIQTKAHLIEFADAVNNGNSYSGRFFQLEADIDFRDERESSRDDHYMSFRGVGTYGHASGYMWQHSVPFCGNFDGMGHTVQGFYINNNEYAVLADHTVPCDYNYSYNAISVGFFAALGNSATVQGLRLANFELNCKYQKPANATGMTEIYKMAVGGIAGSIVPPASTGKEAGEFVIRNCSVENMKITRRSSSLDIQEYHIGGLVGACSSYNGGWNPQFPKVTVSDCYAKNITIDNNINSNTTIFGGAFLGTHFGNGSVNNCILTGTNSAPNVYYFSFADAGGLNFACSTSNVYLTPQTSYTLSSLSSTSGTSGTTWYRHSDYNSGVPYLRSFILWKTVTFNAVNGTVSKESILIPKEITKTYSSSSSSITVMGETITSSGNDGFGVCKGWTCNNASSYTVTYERSHHYLGFENLWYTVSRQSSYAPQCSTFISGTNQIEINEYDTISVSVEHTPYKTIITYSIGSHVITYEIDEIKYTMEEYGYITVENPLYDPGDGPIEMSIIDKSSSGTDDKDIENTAVVLPSIEKYMNIDIVNLSSNFHLLEDGEVYYITSFLVIKTYDTNFN